MPVRRPRQPAQRRFGEVRADCHLEDNAFDPARSAGTFDPKLIAKYQHRSPAFDENIISIMRAEHAVREIRGHLEELFGIDLSPDLISAVTDAEPEEASEWRNMPTDALYPLVFFLAIRIKIGD